MQRRKRFGKIWTRLWELLLDEGFKLNEEDLKPVKGQWKAADVYRWEAQVFDEDWNPVTINSWDTMTRCVKAGITVNEDGYREYEISARYQPSH